MSFSLASLERRFVGAFGVEVEVEEVAGALRLGGYMLLSELYLFYILDTLLTITRWSVYRTCQ